MVSLLARVTEDGYLLGATDDFENGYSERFWADYYQETDLEPDTVEIAVPEAMVQALLDQTYSDGYEAWQDILKNGKFEE